MAAKASKITAPWSAAAPPFRFVSSTTSAIFSFLPDHLVLYTITNYVHDYDGLLALIQVVVAQCSEIYIYRLHGRAELASGIN